MKDTGGQAFPKPATETQSRGYDYSNDGMTLRQWYAGQVLPAAVDHAHASSIVITKAQIAQKCFEMADAMIEEGNK